MKKNSKKWDEFEAHVGMPTAGTLLKLETESVEYETRWTLRTKRRMNQMKGAPCGVRGECDL